MLIAPRPGVGLSVSEYVRRVCETYADFVPIPFADINLVIGAVAAPAYIFLLPNTNTHLNQEPMFRRIKAIDWIGTALISGAVVSGIMAINFGGVLFPWKSGEIIGCFVCSGVLWILFGFQQAFTILTTTEDRIFPCDIIRKWEANVLFAHTACGLGASTVAIYFIPVSTSNPWLRP